MKLLIYSYTSAAAPFGNGRVISPNLCNECNYLPTLALNSIHVCSFQHQSSSYHLSWITDQTTIWNEWRDIGGPIDHINEHSTWLCPWGWHDMETFSTIPTVIGLLLKRSPVGPLIKVTCASKFPLADFSQILHGVWVCYDIAKITIKIGGHHINFLPRSIKVLCHYTKIKVGIHLIQRYIFSLLCF